MNFCGVNGLRPIDFPECPLGLCCTQYGETGKVGNYKWHECINNIYCRFVVSAWLLPFRKREENIDTYLHRVVLSIPHNFSRSKFRAYMKKYGWAESVPLPLNEESSEEYSDPFFNVAQCYVTQNLFNHGYAIALKADLEFAKRYHTKDKNNVFWYLPFGQIPPKDSEVRWAKLAKQSVADELKDQ